MHDIITPNGNYKAITHKKNRKALGTALSLHCWEAGFLTFLFSEKHIN